MAPQFTMRLRDRRVQVGFPVRLTCQIVGIPKPVITWYKEGILMSPDGEFVCRFVYGTFGLYVFKGPLN